MTWPGIQVQIAFASPPAGTPSWTDVSDYALSLHTRRGRQHELNRFEAGVADVTLDNRDGRFDPSNSGGTYYPNVVPVRRLQVAGSVLGTVYPLFTGYVEGYEQQFAGRDHRALVSAVDAFKLLALRKVTTSWTAQPSGTVVASVLDAAGWSPADRDIDAGQSTLAAGSATRDAALSLLQDIDQAENGRLFVSAGGSVTFQDRHAAFKPPYNASMGTIGDSLAELPYLDIRLSYDDSQIWNEVNVSRQGGSVQTASGTASGTAYYTRTLERTGLPIVSDAEALSCANWLLSRYKDPYLRVTSVTLSGQMTDSLWAHALGRDIGDRVTVVKRTPAGGTINQDCIIEAIEHDVAAGERVWRTTWALSPAQAVDVWVLGTSKLGSETKVGY